MSPLPLFDNIDAKAPESPVGAKEPEPGTQNARLLNYLRKQARINPLQSWKILGIYRLSARVFELKALGHKIVTDRLTVRNGWGEEISVASYRLEQGR